MLVARIFLFNIFLTIFAFSLTKIINLKQQSTLKYKHIIKSIRYIKRLGDYFNSYQLTNCGVTYNRSAGNEYFKCFCVFTYKNCNMRVIANLEIQLHHHEITTIPAHYDANKMATDVPAANLLTANISSADISKIDVLRISLLAINLLAISILAVIASLFTRIII